MTAISGSMTPEIAAMLGEEVVARLVLIELDTKQGFVRLVLGEDGVFIDANGVEWIGSKLLNMTSIDFSIGGNAPGIELSLSYIFDPDRQDLVSAIKSYGVSAVNGRFCRIAYQWLSDIEGFFKPVASPFLLTKRKMRNLGYSYKGSQTRQVTLTIEGPFVLRSRPVSGRYTDADQKRRTDSSDPSLEFMPNNATDAEPLFGLA